ncbi:hypothetical protein PTKIN_Ptkin03bG0018500 [Pterospermum kingtungense]
MMNNPWIEKNFNGVNDDMFDDIIQYLDFPLEDVEVAGGGGEDVMKENDGGCEEWECNFQNLEPPPANVLAGLSSGFSGDFFSDSSVKNLPNSCDGSSQLKQCSSTTKTSSRRSITLRNEAAEVKGSTRFLTFCPVSLVGSGSSSSASNPRSIINPKLSFLVKRRRSKRRSASTFNLQFSLPFTSSASSNSRGSNSLAGSESESESYLTDKPYRTRQKKKRNLTLLSCSVEIKKSSSKQPDVLRKCMHCEVTKTPQWREGPMGPKTLCNACGVRYRSGRLFPEYRPAISPTFVPSLHSNSHKKVLEMRKEAEPPTTVTPFVLSTPPEMSC